MNTTATSFSSEHSTWCTPTAVRRDSSESILSIQGKETDYVCDTTDTDWFDSDRDVEYEPVTDEELDAPISAHSSGPSEDEIISTKVITVSVGDDRAVFADAEDVEADSSDGELALHDYWRCVRCHADNNTPLYRYCQKCFQVRKNFFPPRPKRKRRQATAVPTADPVTKLTEVIDSGVDSGFNSQETNSSQTSLPSNSQSDIQILKVDTNTAIKRRRFRKCKSDLTNATDKNLSDYSDPSSDDDSASSKRAKLDVQPLVKTVSDPQITVESDSQLMLTKRALVTSLKDRSESRQELCITCLSAPKSGVFVHGRVAHICCCYPCAVRVWARARRCPLCNSRVSNVLKAVVM